MAGDLTTNLQKPEMRGLLQSSIKKNLGIAIGLSVVGAIAVRVFIGDSRKARYAEFYK